MELPNPKNIDTLNIPVLDRLTKLIYHPLFGILYRKRYQMALSCLNEINEKVLEIGCGGGLFLLPLSMRCSKVYAIDIHKRMEVINRILKREDVFNVFSISGNITKIPYRDKVFDTLICISVLEHFKDLQICFEEFFRVLKDSGELIIGFPVKNWLTNLLLKLIKYNAQEIHPSSHRDIIDAANSRFLLKSFMTYPKYFPADYSLYFVGKFIKRR